MFFSFWKPEAGYFSRFVYIDGGASIEVHPPSAAPEAEAPLPEVTYDPNKNKNDLWSSIDEKYGQSAYEAIITAYVDRITPGDTGTYKSDLVRNSVTRYVPFYQRVRLDFMQQATVLKQHFDSAVDQVKRKTKEDLAILKSAVEGSRNLIGFTEAMPGPEDKPTVRGYFKKYLEALNGRYFNVSVQMGRIRGPGLPLIDPLVHVEAGTIPLIGPVFDRRSFERSRYESLAGKMQKNMANWVDAKLNWLLEQPGTKKEDLEAFKNEIAARYQFYASPDKDSSTISTTDLSTLEAASRPQADTVPRILDESDDRTVARLELMQIMNSDGWQEAIVMAGRSVIEAAKNSGAEKEFVAEMQKYRPAVKDFGDAKSEFKDLLSDLSKVGVKETLDFLRKFNTGVHGEVLQYEENIQPAALSMQVHKQMDYLLSGILVPQKDTDRMLVRFMNSDRKRRDDILKDDGSRELLMRAIVEATKDYPQVYEKMNIPDDVTKLRRSPDIQQPTYHDRAAQLQALIIFGNEAKVIISRLERTPQHSGRGYIDQINRTEASHDVDPSRILTGLRFAPAGADGPRFRSALDRGGFNTRDLALKGAKILGVLAVVSNVAQSWSETHGELPDRILDTIEKAATNQGVLVGAAVATGAHLAERNKDFLRYPWLSQYQREGAMTAFKLDNLAARVGSAELSRFMNNPAEWRALDDPAMDGGRIQGLIQTAGKRTARGAYPVIDVTDLGGPGTRARTSQQAEQGEAVITDQSILALLTRGGKSARTRYLFYKDFFASATKPDVHTMKALCTGSSSFETPRT